MISLLFYFSRRVKPRFAFMQIYNLTRKLYYLQLKILWVHSFNLSSILIINTYSSYELNSLIIFIIPPPPLYKSINQSIQISQPLKQKKIFIENGCIMRFFEYRVEKIIFKNYINKEYRKRRINKEDKYQSCRYKICFKKIRSELL